MRSWFKSLFLRSSESGPTNAGLSVATPPIFIGERSVDPSRSSIVLAALRYAGRTFPEAKLRIMAVAEGEDEPVENHVGLNLLENPSPYAKTGITHVLKAAIYWLMLDGNAYIYKVRNGGTIIGLEVLPATSVAPKGVNYSTNQLSHYEVRLTGGASANIDPDDMIHVIDDVDPECSFKGRSPFRALMREVMTDLEVQRYQHAIMKAPHPKALISGDGMSLNDSAVDGLVQSMRSSASGEQSGNTIISSDPLKVDSLSLTPEQMALDIIPKLPEERITAVFGIPAIVLGLGAGLDRSTFANYKEAREAATETFLIPYWRLVADALTIQLLPEIGGKDGEYIEFDLRTVRALSEDDDARHQRAREDYKSNMVDRATAKRMVGMEATTDDEGIYYEDTKGSPMGDALKEAMRARAQNVPE